MDIDIDIAARMKKAAGLAPGGFQGRRFGWFRLALKSLPCSA